MKYNSLVAKGYFDNASKTLYFFDKFWIMLSYRTDSGITHITIRTENVLKAGPPVDHGESNVFGPVADQEITLWLRFSSNLNVWMLDVRIDTTLVFIFDLWDGPLCEYIQNL